MSASITRKAPSVIYRKVAISPTSYSEKDNSIQVVFATDTPVHRFDWREWEEFDEVLLIENAALMLERLDAGSVPFLKDHANSVDTTLGRVMKVWIDKGEAWAQIKLSGRKAHEDLINDIKDGILRNISVGYAVHEYDRLPKGKDQVRRKYIARKWELLEVSLVGVPADHKSSVRSKDGGNEDHFITINDLTESNMSQDNQGVNTPPTPPVTPPQPPVTPPTEQQRSHVDVEQIRAEERRRFNEINEYSRTLGLSDEFAASLINSSKTIDQCRAALLEEAKTRNVAQKVVNVNSANQQPTVGEFRKVAVAGMLMRAGYGQIAEKQFDAKVLEEGHVLRSVSLLDLAKESLYASGVSTHEVRRMTAFEVVKRAITSSTSDFAVALQDLNNIILLNNYRTQKLIWNQFCATGSNGDFRENKRMRGGSLGNISRLQENGEYKTKVIPDADFEKTQVSTWGEMINISRKMIVDDQFGYFTTLASSLGAAMARTIEVEVFKALFLNNGNGPNLVDGNPIFHSSHANITTAGGLTVEKLNEAYVLMRKQMEKNKNDYIEVTPQVLLIDVARRGDALIYNSAEFNPDTTNNRNIPNKVRGLFGNIVDSPRMDDSAYYIFANPAEFPVLEVTYLNGQTEPMMEYEIGFDVDGVRLKIRHDFDVNAVGYRGAVKVPKT